MAILRFCVVFLLGLGAALGAYATGALDYVAHQHYFRSWYQPAPAVVGERDMVLRVSGNALNGFCTERYAVDNRSGHRIFVVFAPEAGADTRFAPRRGPYGYEGFDDDRYASDAEPDAYGSYADAGEEFRPADGPYHREDPYRDADPRAAQYAPDYPARVANDQVPPPFEVAPGEKKILGLSDAVGVADDPYGVENDVAGRCGDDRIVKLQITDCAAGDGACVAAINSSGGTNP